MAFVALVVVRMFVLDAKEKTAVEVAKIHATKLTIEDVMGKNLPAAFAGRLRRASRLRGGRLRRGRLIMTQLCRG